MGRIRHGVRGRLWEIAMETMDYRVYGVFEAVTVQYALFPLCLHSTLAKMFAARHSTAHFKDPYENCFPTHMSYAVDHLILAGENGRALETYELARAHPLSSRLFTESWVDFHYTPIGGLQGLLAHPWWHRHPQVANIVSFLENELYPVLREELPVLRADKRWTQSDLYPATSRGLRWLGVDYYSPCDPQGLHTCKLTPRTCKMLIEQFGWSRARDFVDRKWSWSIVAPGERMGGHSGQASRINIQLCAHGCEGSELILAGQRTPFHAGRALAWQDGWRHEVLNHGTEHRWVLIITIVHPDLQRGYGVELGDDGKDIVVAPSTEVLTPTFCPTTGKMIARPLARPSGDALVGPRRVIATSGAPLLDATRFEATKDIENDPVLKWYCDREKWEKSNTAEGHIFKAPRKWKEVFDIVGAEKALARSPDAVLEEHRMVTRAREAYD